jgi:hypothetical protein
MASKLSDTSAGITSALRERNLRTGLAFLICVMLSAPLLYEGTLMCYGHWMEALGRPVDVRTPMLDRISDQIETARSDSSRAMNSYFAHAAVDPKALFVVGMVILVLAGLMLRS